MANYLTEKRVIDFYHAAGHLDTALAAAYGDTHPKRRAQFEKQRHVLLEDYKGVEKVIRSLVHLRDTYPRRKKIEVFSAQSASNALRGAQGTRSADRFRSHGGSVQDSSNATHEEVRNAMGRARRPSHSIALSCRAIASSEPGPCSHIPTRRRLRLSTMSCRYAVGNDRCQYESYTHDDLVVFDGVVRRRFERGAHRRRMRYAVNSKGTSSDDRVVMSDVVFDGVVRRKTLAQEEEQQELQPVSRQEILQKQRREKAANLEPYEVSGAEKRARNWEKAKFPQNWLVKGWHGFRPVFGGMPSGSGFALGGGYIHGLESQYFQFQANGRYSTRGYTTADAEVVFPPPQIGRRIEIKIPRRVS